MRVLGIDPSTKSGLVCLDETGDHASILQSTTMTGIRRVEWIGTKFEAYLDAHDAIDVAVIEGYAFANRFTLATLVEIGVTLRLILYRRGIPCYICPPSVLKKYATGKGNSKKPQVAEAVKEKWGFESPSDDVIDAYVLAKIASVLASGNQVHGLEFLI